MRPTPHLCIVVASLLPMVANAQSTPDYRAPRGVYAYSFSLFDGENSDDPGYPLFRTGYNMVLNERWQEANAVFLDLEESFPESEYSDDAIYWTGYSWFQRNNFDKAIEAYDRLIADFPGSEYYDDAVADLTEAQMRIQIDDLSGELGRAVAPFDDHLMEQHTRDLERQLKRLTWSRHVFPGPGQDVTDPETQLRVDALNALSPDAGDKTSFETLKEVALDGKNPVVLRQYAVHILAGAEAEMSLPVFLTLAKDDTNKTLRVLSLDYLAQVPGDKSVDALIEVFHTIPSQEDELSARVFYTIAEVGNDRAVDFLASVARTHSDLNLRREAVFYLGAIGSERSRAALQSILRGRD